VNSRRLDRSFTRSGTGFSYRRSLAKKVLRRRRAVALSAREDAQSDRAADENISQDGNTKPDRRDGTGSPGGSDRDRAPGEE